MQKFEIFKPEWLAHISQIFTNFDVKVTSSNAKGDRISMHVHCKVRCSCGEHDAMSHLCNECMGRALSHELTTNAYIPLAYVCYVKHNSSISYSRDGSNHE